MTFEEKLEKFKSGTAALHTPTQEIWDELMIELEKRGYKWGSGMIPTDKHWDSDWSTVILNYSIIYYWDDSASTLEITEEDFTAPSETVESVMESIEEVKADLKFYDELFKKYDVIMTGNLESTMRVKLERLLKKRVIS